MPAALVPFWRLRQHGVAEEAVRGGSRRPAPDRSWPLPGPVRERLRPLLEALGFDPEGPVTVREPAGRDALELSQGEEAER